MPSEAVLHSRDLLRARKSEPRVACVGGELRGRAEPAWEQTETSCVAANSDPAKPPAAANTALPHQAVPDKPCWEQQPESTRNQIDHPSKAAECAAKTAPRDPPYEKLDSAKAAAPHEKPSLLKRDAAAAAAAAEKTIPSLTPHRAAMPVGHDRGEKQPATEEKTGLPAAPPGMDDRWAMDLVEMTLEKAFPENVIEGAKDAVRRSSVSFSFKSGCGGDNDASSYGLGTRRESTTSAAEVESCASSELNYARVTKHLAIEQALDEIRQHLVRTSWGDVFGEIRSYATKRKRATCAQEASRGDGSSDGHGNDRVVYDNSSLGDDLESESNGSDDELSPETITTLATGVCQALAILTNTMMQYQQDTTAEVELTVKNDVTAAENDSNDPFSPTTSSTPGVSPRPLPSARATPIETESISSQSPVVGPQDTASEQASPPSYPSSAALPPQPRPLPPLWPEKPAADAAPPIAAGSSQLTSADLQRSVHTPTHTGSPPSSATSAEPAPSPSPVSTPSLAERRCFFAAKKRQAAPAEPANPKPEAVAAAARAAAVPEKADGGPAGLRAPTATTTTAGSETCRDGSEQSERPPCSGCSEGGVCAVDADAALTKKAAGGLVVDAAQCQGKAAEEHYEFVVSPSSEPSPQNRGPVELSDSVELTSPETDAAQSYQLTVHHATGTGERSPNALNSRGVPFTESSDRSGEDVLTPSLAYSASDAGNDEHLSRHANDLRSSPMLESETSAPDSGELLLLKSPPARGLPPAKRQLGFSGSTGEGGAADSAGIQKQGAAGATRQGPEPAGTLANKTAEGPASRLVPEDAAGGSDEMLPNKAPREASPVPASHDGQRQQENAPTARTPRTCDGEGGRPSLAQTRPNTSFGSSDAIPPLPAPTGPPARVGSQEEENPPTVRTDSERSRASLVQQQTRPNTSFGSSDAIPPLPTPVGPPARVSSQEEENPPTVRTDSERSRASLVRQQTRPNTSFGSSDAIPPLPTPVGPPARVGSQEEECEAPEGTRALSAQQTRPTAGSPEAPPQLVLGEHLADDSCDLRSSFEDSVGQGSLVDSRAPSSFGRRILQKNDPPLNLTLQTSNLSDRNASMKRKKSRSPAAHDRERAAAREEPEAPAKKAFAPCDLGEPIDRQGSSNTVVSSSHSLCVDESGTPWVKGIPRKLSVTYPPKVLSSAHQAKFASKTAAAAKAALPTLTQAKPGQKADDQPAADDPPSDLKEPDPVDTEAQNVSRFLSEFQKQGVDTCSDLLEGTPVTLSLMPFPVRRQVDTFHQQTTESHILLWARLLVSKEARALTEGQTFEIFVNLIGKKNYPSSQRGAASRRRFNAFEVVPSFGNLQNVNNEMHRNLCKQNSVIRSRSLNEAVYYLKVTLVRIAEHIIQTVLLGEFTSSIPRKLSLASQPTLLRTLMLRRRSQPLDGTDISRSGSTGAMRRLLTQPPLARRLTAHDVLLEELW
ncbi:hypothetical protein DIPPA_25033 [Diplonema papillatum]|nr:hypothetical protein DIPPA_25033 [Diplonema papillatum]